MFELVVQLYNICTYSDETFQFLSSQLAIKYFTLNFIIELFFFFFIVHYVNKLFYFINISRIE